MINILEWLFMLAFFFLILLFVTLMINAIHFYKKYYKQLSESIDGAFFDSGFLFASSRFMLWGHYCLFPKRAERANVYSIFEALPKSARLQLKLHWFGILSICLLGAGGGIMSKYFLH
ncbi:hypothetical protein [Endozoicomonas numazuensis]|uniref:Uncharacterized protein n=1 Tax=Endozoicomonas numazuensis TaxID=1137799 RepID=A0A081NLN5_9GAMM|nr:hypothetical protein [Endozoicomonas numazuensis]KEQ19358.1 hypothetical protein GZ78_05185 [Endozoicomonas numazuensis]